MLTAFLIYQCKGCDKEFVLTEGGIIYIHHPTIGKKCPHCGSRLTYMKRRVSNGDKDFEKYLKPITDEK